MMKSTLFSLFAYISMTSYGQQSVAWKASDMQAVLGRETGNTQLSMPVFSEAVIVDGKCYAFVVNHYPGELTRLDFGESFENEPKSVYLGNPGKVLNGGYGSESINIINYKNEWWLMVVGGTRYARTTPKISLLKLGSDITNTKPSTASHSSGLPDQPVDMVLMKDQDGMLIGFVTSADLNTVTRVKFAADLTDKPRMTTIKSILFKYPTGLAIEKNTGDSKTLLLASTKESEILRLDFGKDWNSEPEISSYLTVEKGSLPRDVMLIDGCKGQQLLVADQNGILWSKLPSEQELQQLNLGESSDLAFPHGFSSQLVQGDKSYIFLTDVGAKNLFRIKLEKEGCP